MMRKAFLFSLVVIVLAPAFAEAQRFEITPFAGYRFGGGFDDFDFGDNFDFEDTDSLGVVLSFGVSEGAFVELLYSTQETGLQEEAGFFGDRTLFDVTVDYWHVGGLYQWNIGQMKPFVVATVGITEFDPRPEALSSETRFSMGIGGGIKLMLGDHFGFRFEGRGFTTFVDSEDEIFCDPSRCYGYTDTTFLWQVEARAGIVLAF